MLIQIWSNTKEYKVKVLLLKGYLPVAEQIFLYALFFSLSVLGTMFLVGKSVSLVILKAV